jgi:insulysin
VSEHGGHTNAYTSAESTNYHFDVNWDALEPALDRCVCCLVRWLCFSLGGVRGWWGWRGCDQIHTTCTYFGCRCRRFAQFFICPLISADGVDREAKAVDSE